jgi:hypothetical protein
MDEDLDRCSASLDSVIAAGFLFAENRSEMLGIDAASPVSPRRGRIRPTSELATRSASVA